MKIGAHRTRRVPPKFEEVSRSSPDLTMPKPGPYSQDAMRWIEAHESYVGRIGLLLCALLCAAPCSATDGRFFPDPLPDVSQATCARAPGLPDARQDPYVVLAPGVVSQTLSRPKPPHSQTVERVDMHSVRCATLPSRPAPPDRSSRPIRGTDERDTHLRVCVLLI
jgi:hypothetical protein